MPPTQSHNRLDRKNSINDGQKTHILTKDGLKVFGTKANLKKKTSPGFVEMDSSHINVMVDEARRLNKDTESDGGNAHRATSKPATAKLSLVCQKSNLVGLELELLLRNMVVALLTMKYTWSLCQIQ